MKKLRVKRLTLVLYAVGLLLSPRILQAQVDLQLKSPVVGTCTNLPFTETYTTISAAVAGAAANSTVMVCPGTYAEQVVIAKPLTLQGITGGNTNRAIIVPPAGGVQVPATSISGYYIAAQVLVEAGPVNITNITVDGRNVNGGIPGITYMVGIFYGSGSSGTVNGVTARQQTTLGTGVGIWAENGTSTMETVTIEHSDIHDVDWAGIWTQSTQSPPTLTVTVKGNTVTGETCVREAGGQETDCDTSVMGPLVGINNLGATGSIANNVINGYTSAGIQDQGSTVSISNNTTTNISPGWGSAGIVLAGTDEVVTGNLVLNNNNQGLPNYITINGVLDLTNANGPGPTPGGSVGINIYTPSATVQDNKIANSYIAIEFNCNSATVSGNAINDAVIGIDSVPLSLAVTYAANYNVDTVQGATSSCFGGEAPKPALLRHH